MPALPTVTGDVVAVCPLAALREEGARWAQDGVALVRQGGRVYAFEDTCPHLQVSLVDADVSRGAVSCPAHGGRFRLADGKRLAGPSPRPLTCFDVEQSGEDLLVRPRAGVPAALPWWVRVAGWVRVHGRGPVGPR